jgi:FAD/FMN-containing dehydrogenase
MGQYSGLKLYFLMVLYSTNCRLCGRIIQVSRNLAGRMSRLKRRLGYDLKQLFIGAEGTLGIITAVSILTQPAPQATNNVVLALPSFDNVKPLFRKVKRELSEVLSAFEFFDREAYEIVTKHNQGRALAAEDVGDAQCFVLVETSGGRKEHDEEVCWVHPYLI